MKTGLSCQLATRHAFGRSTRDFQLRVPGISNFSMDILVRTVHLRCGKNDRISH